MMMMVMFTDLLQRPHGCVDLIPILQLIMTTTIITTSIIITNGIFITTSIIVVLR
jgi:hypothetical protein